MKKLITAIKSIKIETTKKLLIFTDLLLAISVAFTFAGWFKGLEPSAIVQLDIGLIGLSATLHGFYVWKSKIENCAKYPNLTELIKSGVVSYNDL